MKKIILCILACISYKIVCSTRENDAYNNFVTQIQKNTELEGATVEINREALKSYMSEVHQHPNQAQLTVYVGCLLHQKKTFSTEKLPVLKSVEDQEQVRSYFMNYISFLSENNLESSVVQLLEERQRAIASIEEKSIEVYRNFVLEVTQTLTTENVQYYENTPSIFEKISERILEKTIQIIDSGEVPSRIDVELSLFYSSLFLQSNLLLMVNKSANNDNEFKTIGIKSDLLNNNGLIEQYNEIFLKYREKFLEYTTY